MNAQFGYVSQVEPVAELVAEDADMGFDHVPGMALVGFFTGSVFSLGIWVALGWVAWQFVG